MIAHAGGVDEIILGVGLVVLFLLFRSSRAERRAIEPDEGPCLYCGTHLGPGVERCPECGFRARRAIENEGAPRVRSSASGAAR